MSFKKMDPSCTIGFYCRTVQDFEKASEEITKVGVNSSAGTGGVAVYGSGENQLHRHRPFLVGYCCLCHHEKSSLLFISLGFACW